MQRKATYKFILLLNLCFLLNIFNVQAQTAYISNSFTDTMLCVNAQFSVPITVTGSFAMSNHFTVEISNASGSFANPDTVGYYYGVGPGTAYCLLPGSITAGTGYQFRVHALSPAYTSAPFGKTIRVSNFPTVNAGANGPICEGDTVHLTASSPSASPTYSWTGPNNFSSTLQNPDIYGATTAAKGKYTVYITSYACTSYDTINADVTPAPRIDSVRNTSPVCENDELNINVWVNLPNIPPPAWTYPSNVVKNAGGIWFEHTKLSDGGMYFVKVTVGNCWDTGHTFVTVKPLPDTPKASSNSPICVGETLQLNGTTTTQGVTYRWEGPNSFTATGPTASKTNINKNDEGDYILYAKKNSCESGGGKTKVDVGIPLVALTVTGDTLLCPGDKLQLSAKTSSTKGIEWKKDNNSNAVSILRTLSISPVQAGDAGTYSVTQEEAGCKSPPTYVTVKIPDLREPKPENNGPLCIGEALNLDITPTPDGTYSWTGPGGFTSNAQNPGIEHVTPAADGTYIIKADLEYCSVTDSTSVVIKPMPEIQNISSNSPVCTSTTLELYTESTLPNSTFAWTGPNGFTSDKQNPTMPFDGSMAGTYEVRATTDKCVSAPATTIVEAREGPGGSVARNNSPIDEGATLELYANNDKDSVTFSWEGPDGFTSNERNPVIPIATYRNSGEYVLTSNYNGCTTTTTTTVSVKDILGITLDLYPNPNKGRFTISGISQTDNTLTMNIYNHQGMIVHKSTVQPNKSKFNTIVDLGNTPSGVYILQLVSGIEKRIVRFTVIQQ